MTRALFRHIVHRQLIHMPAGAALYLAMTRFWPPAWVTEGAIVTLTIMVVVAMREVWDLRALKRAAVRIVSGTERPGDRQYVMENSWWKSLIDTPFWAVGALFVALLMSYL